MVITALAATSLCIHQLNETLERVIAGTVLIGTFTILLSAAIRYISAMSEVIEEEDKELESLKEELIIIKEDDPEKWDEAKKQKYLELLEIQKHERKCHKLKRNEFGYLIQMNEEKS